MTDRSDLVRAIHQAQDGTALAQAVAALDRHDSQRAAALAASRELDLGAHLAAQRLTPAPLHEHHTAATDWLMEAPDAPADGYRTAMIAEASTWYARLDPAVRSDTEELAEQARGRARSLASAHGSLAPAAEREFLQVVSYLHSTQAASGLPQIDQTVDPNNAPSATPYPVEVFPTFGEEQDPFNGVETNAHGSGATSERAPMLQQIQQETGGSGYGSGPEKPVTHDTGFDTANSYAEVPLGTPGAIPAEPGSQISAPSTPNPADGAGPMVAGGQGEDPDRRQAMAAIQGYSLPDPFGYRWAMSTEIMHPFHERCASAHWPDETCGDHAHTASVAIGYRTDIDKMRRQAACEQLGVQEGLRAVTSAPSLADLGAHHNRFAAAWNESGRTADDTAVLHGFMAVVRPVLAEIGHEAAACSCCKDCKGKGCGCCGDCGSHHEAKKKHQPGGLANGGVTEKERANAKHTLPGTDKFPIDSAADVENAKHDIGRTNEPKSKVVNYIDDMAKEYGAAPVGGGKGKSKKDHAKAASRLDFKEGASGLSQIQQVTDPNNVPVPQDDQLPEGVAFPIDPGFAQQWVTGPQGAQPKAGHEAAAIRGLPQSAAWEWGHAHATGGKAPMNKNDWQYSPQRHGDYLQSYNQTAGLIHGLVGKAPMSKQEYATATGRPDLHAHYLSAYAEGRKRHTSQQGVYDGEGQAVTAGIQAQADAWSQPKQTTDDQYAPYNSPATTPPMTQDDGDHAAGVAAGKADRAAGSRPAFADNSSAVSPYVKGYAEGYGAPEPSQAPQDVPYSMGGDSGQAQNAQEAQRAFQVARASRRTSAAFAPDALLADPEFRRGYLFASKWRPGQRLVAQGSAKFEAGMYAGITDSTSERQGAWLRAHLNSRHEVLGQRIALHRSFTAKINRRRGVRSAVAYLDRTAGVTTDLITDGPGTSPDPMGSTPLNGPGTPPPMGGMDNANAPGGAPPYQGAPPLPGGPVAPDDVMGKPQQKPQQSGPFTNTFSGNHPENADLAPVAPNSANEPGYSNKGAYKGDPNVDKVAKLAAFRATVQASIARMGAQQ